MRSILTGWTSGLTWRLCWRFDRAEWREEVQSIAEFLQEFEPRVPRALRDELARVRSALDQ